MSKVVDNLWITFARALRARCDKMSQAPGPRNLLPAIFDPLPPLFDKHALAKSKGLFESDNYVKKRYKEVGRKIFKK